MNLSPFHRHAHSAALKAELEGFTAFAAALRAMLPQGPDWPDARLTGREMAAALATPRHDQGLTPNRSRYGKTTVRQVPWGAVEAPAVSPTLDR